MNEFRYNYWNCIKKANKCSCRDLNGHIFDSEREKSNEFRPGIRQSQITGLKRRFHGLEFRNLFKEFILINVIISGENHTKLAQVTNGDLHLQIIYFTYIFNSRP